MERFQYLLPSTLETRFLILYGKGVDDTYISERLVERGLPETILDSLKERGYQRVVFFSPHRSIYYLDQETQRKVHQPLQARATAQASERYQALEGLSTPGRMEHLAGGPLGDLMLIDTDSPRQGAGDGQPVKEGGGMGDVHAIRALDAMMRDQAAPPTAIVFVQAETVFRYFEDPRTLAGLLGEWLSLPAANPHLCVLLFSVEAYPQLTELAPGLPIPELRSFLNRSNREKERVSSLVQVGGPGAQEMHQLLAYLHRLQGLQVNPEETGQLCRWMAAENCTANQWVRRLREVERLSVEVAVQKGWFSGRLATRESPQKRLAALTGLQEVKQRVKEIAALAAATQQDVAACAEDAPAHHMIFTGNPGTGKTTVARLVGEILHEAGVLRRGHLVEARAAELLADHVGGTALKTNAVIDQALDGVLFIDEAYALADSGRGSYGQECIETLMTRMEDERQRLVVIAAGYPDRMEKFLSANPGLRRRFARDHIIHFPDYSVDELVEIFRRMLRRRRLTCPGEVDAMLNQVIQGLAAGRDDEFGNAGEMRNLADGLRMRCAARLQGQPARRMPLAMEDLPEQYRPYLPVESPDIATLFAELNQLVGLENVKAHLQGMVRRIQFEQMRAEEEDQPQAPVLLQHLIFLGNPGTGKTTVARLLGKFFSGLGLLRKGHCVEVGRADLVAGYVGQTAERTTDCIRRALDGVLFIDEAYALTRGGEHDFGREAVDTLVKAMEDYRGRLVVIAAGYPQEMGTFMRSNTGLPSRFAPPIEFHDYSNDELVQILGNMAAAEGYRLEDEACSVLTAAFQNRRLSEGDSFGNAREARQVYDAMKGSLASRVIQARQAGKAVAADALHLLSAQDIPVLTQREMVSQPNLYPEVMASQDHPLS